MEEGGTDGERGQAGDGGGGGTGEASASTVGSNNIMCTIAEDSDEDEKNSYTQTCNSFEDDVSTEAGTRGGESSVDGGSGARDEKSPNSFEIVETILTSGTSKMFTKTMNRKMQFRAVTHEEAKDFVGALKRSKLLVPS